jgi:uracil-DNA glycosylase
MYAFILKMKGIIYYIYYNMLAMDRVEELKNKLYNKCVDWQPLLSEPKLDALFTKCLEQIIDLTVIHPAKIDILNAFAFTRFKDVKVVILGQDPYYIPGVADGLAFSTDYRSKSIPKSLNNIYNKLIDDGLIGPLKSGCNDASKLNLNWKPNHGCLMSWAKRGVLLLNCQLTTTTLSDQHPFWQEYTTMLIERIAQSFPNAYYCLWGNFAQRKGRDANIRGYVRRENVLEYRHPSPQANIGMKWDCPHFKIISDKIGFDWEPYTYTLYFAATDGACPGNGEPDAKGGVGIYFPDSVLGYENGHKGQYSAHLPAKCTNNIAELTAMVDCLSYFIGSASKQIKENSIYKPKLTVITDSKYVKDSIEEGRIWKHQDYANPDLLKKIADRMEYIYNNCKFIIIHVNSHKKPSEYNAYKEPTRTWYEMNAFADTLADEAARIE